jgi:hypothetical protein
MSPGTKIIGLAGPAGAGKDTVADYMVNRTQRVHAPGVSIPVADGFGVGVKMAFADPIREAVKAIFGWDDEDLASRPVKEAVDDLFGVSPRYAMQTLGTEWGRETINEDLWLLAMRRRIGQLGDHVRLVVIPDVRFENEVDLIHSFRGVVMWVDRPDARPVNEHASEALRPEAADGIIYNHGTLDELPRAIEVAFGKPVAEARR